MIETLQSAKEKWELTITEENQWQCVGCFLSFTFLEIVACGDTIEQPKTFKINLNRISDLLYKWFVIWKLNLFTQNVYLLNLENQSMFKILIAMNIMLENI